jgi:hypothetical protein
VESRSQEHPGLVLPEAPAAFVIVVGDACTDDTANAIASFADARLRFVNMPRNHGEQSAPNNEGVGWRARIGRPKTRPSESGLKARVRSSHAHLSRA